VFSPEVSKLSLSFYLRCFGTMKNASKEFKKDWCDPNSKDNCPLCRECNAGIRPEDDRAKVQLTNLIRSQRHAKKCNEYSGFLEASELEYKRRYGVPLP
jgi:hypothetical protein